MNEQGNVGYYDNEYAQKEESGNQKTKSYKKSGRKHQRDHGVVSEAHASNPSLPNIQPRSQLDRMSHEGDDNRLPAIHNERGAGGNYPLGVVGRAAAANRPLHNAASNAEIYSYKRQEDNYDALQDHNAVVSMLSRAKSKDHLHQNNIRDRYMLIAGAQQVLAGGRQDKDRLLMDRYRREGELDMYAGGHPPPRSNVVSQEPTSYRVGSRNKDNNRAIRQMNQNEERLQNEILHKYLPPSS